MEIPKKATVQIALLRGVMPMGRNRVPMAELRKLLADLGFDGVRTYNPFPDDAAKQPSKLLVTVLKSAPNKDGIRAFEALIESPDKCRVINDVAWIVFTAASSLSKLTPAAYRRTLGVSGTARNWNTVLKLRVLAVEVGADRRA